jgi:hypothetical protein
VIAGRISTSISSDGPRRNADGGGRSTDNVSVHWRAQPTVLRASPQARLPSALLTSLRRRGASKIHFLDQLGVGLAAATLAIAHWLRSHPRSERGQFDGPRLCSLGDGCGGSASQRRARHSLEYDATHTASITHAGSVVAPWRLLCARRRARPAPDFCALLSSAGKCSCLGWLRRAPSRSAVPVHRGGRTLSRGAHGEPPVGARGRDSDERAGHRRQPGKRCVGSCTRATVKALHAGWPAHAGLLAHGSPRLG